MNTNIPAKLINDKFMEKIASNDLNKAAEVATDFTRLTLREEGLLRKILPPQTITAAELDKQLDTDEPVKIIDKEVSQPLSMSVGFATLPKNRIMKGDRYRVDFARILSPSYFQDVRRLEQYDYDIRNVFKENAIKDHMTAEDVPFFAAVDAIVGGTGNAASSVTGKVQYYDFSTSNNPLGSAVNFDRNSIVEATKILSKGYTPGPNALGKDSTPIRLNTDLIVMNANTGREYLKLQSQQQREAAKMERDESRKQQLHELKLRETAAKDNDKHKAFKIEELFSGSNPEDRIFVSIDSNLENIFLSTKIISAIKEKHPDKKIFVGSSEICQAVFSGNTMIESAIIKNKEFEDPEFLKKNFFESTLASSLPGAGLS